MNRHHYEALKLLIHRVPADEVIPIFFELSFKLYTRDREKLFCELIKSAAPTFSSNHIDRVLPIIKYHVYKSSYFETLIALASKMTMDHVLDELAHIFTYLNNARNDISEAAWEAFTYFILFLPDDKVRQNYLPVIIPFLHHYYIEVCLQAKQIISYLITTQRYSASEFPHEIEFSLIEQLSLQLNNQLQIQETISPTPKP